MKNYNIIVSFNVIIYLILVIFTNIIGILPKDRFSIGIMGAEVVIIVVTIIFFKGKIQFSKKYIYFFILVTTFQIIAYSFNFIEKFSCYDIHRFILFVLYFGVTWICSKKVYITVEYFERMLMVLNFIGIISVIYNLSKYIYIFKTLDISIIMRYTSKFTSFFNTRSNYCLFLCICCISCLYLYENKKNSILSIILYIVFAVNIVITNARTSIVVIFCLSIWYLFFKKRKIFWGGMSGIFFIILYKGEYIVKNIYVFFNRYYLLIRHGKNLNDISNGRFALWESAIEATNGISFFIGHGIGAKDSYLASIKAPVLSFHNLWIDLFFEGGIIFVVFHISLIFILLIRIEKSEMNKNLKMLFYGYFLIYMLTGMGDSIATLFMTDTMSLYTTCLFVICPISILNYCRKEKKC